jgi:ATP-binding protein involved in chromosome partitioning
VRIAIPITNGLLSKHFGHSERFAFFRVNEQDATFVRDGEAAPPTHSHGVLPRWLKELGVNVVIAGGMGSRALPLFDSTGIAVIIAAPSCAPDQVVREYLAGSLQISNGACTQDGHSCGHHQGGCECGGHC